MTLSVTAICYRTDKVTTQVDRLKAEGRPSVGLGTDFRLQSKKVTGFALALDDQILHVSIFGLADGSNKNIHTSRMKSFTQSRRNRVY